ncbi:MBL fold metallo-hydrolase [Microbacterium hominis]|uniref:MBL fold metallo-hydrolase n=1 Tax=Microbacterium hominis TaxID=162426 RepID=A0A7D4PNP7_9MICO|nr:MBL fold metallo-hydrolase [Microbacterium hominis]QKJ20455.1 MBL fold metallo-hydrolase [Microbacterium hominis]
MHVTRIGGPTLLVELDGWRLVIDPTFDPPGHRYRFAFGTSSVKTLGPALPAEAMLPVDIALVSHDHHADNLDEAGRALLRSATHVITTESGARRLGLPQAVGLAPAASTHLAGDGRPDLTITATPCRHGPPLSHPIVGDVIGFAVRRTGDDGMALWVTGDTVLTADVRRTASAMAVDVAIVNVGGVRFGLTGLLRYTMTGADAMELIELLQPRVAVPAHYDGWSHFADGIDGLRRAVDSAPPSVREKIRWLEDGVPTDLG